MKKLVTVFLATIAISLTTFAQTYELDKVRQMPSIDEANMKIIAFTIQELYATTIKNPEKNSTIKAVSETVSAFYEPMEENNKYVKVNPINGKQYTSNDKEDLDKNTRLLFNLTFDENGKLIVPSKIYVISHREEDQADRTFIVGLLAFQLIITEDIKAKLSKVTLKHLAKADINSLTGELNPVSIKIPFEISAGLPRLYETTGKASRWRANTYISFNRYFTKNKREELIEMIKKQTEILEYKRGYFDFVLENKSQEYYIDFNIMRGIMYSSQPKSFSVETKTIIKSFTGEGKRIKK